MSQPLLALGAHGADVALLHQALLEAGLLPPEALEEETSLDYGPVTAGAVATLQAKLGLVPDGICGPRTWKAIAEAGDLAPLPPGLLDDAGDASPLGRLALIHLERLVRLGVKETPRGSNRGSMVDRILVGLYGDGPDLLCLRRYLDKSCPHCDGKPRPTERCHGAPWCGRTPKWGFDTAAQQLGVASPVAGWGDLASAAKWNDQAKRRRCLVETPAVGRVGLILIPARDGRPAHGHVVTVASRLGADGRFATFEGNSGDRMASRRRLPEECTGGFVELG